MKRSGSEIRGQLLPIVQWVTAGLLLRSNKVIDNFCTLCRIFPLELKSNGFSSPGSTSIHSDVLSLTTPPALLTPFVFSYSAEGPTYTWGQRSHVDMHEQSKNHICPNNGKPWCAKCVGYILANTRPHSCIMKWGLLFHARKTVRWLALSMCQVEASQRLCI